MRLFNYVSRDGYALDSYGNEVLDSKGVPILVPEDERANYDLAYRPNEEPGEDE
jgi:hypothetical protein